MSPLVLCTIVKSSFFSASGTPNLATQMAAQGLSANEIGCARISIMARSRRLHTKAGYISAGPTSPLPKAYRDARTI